MMIGASISEGNEFFNTLAKALVKLQFLINLSPQFLSPWTITLRRYCAQDHDVLCSVSVWSVILGRTVRWLAAFRPCTGDWLLVPVLLWWFCTSENIEWLKKNPCIIMEQHIFWRAQYLQIGGKKKECFETSGIWRRKSLCVCMCSHRTEILDDYHTTIYTIHCISDFCLI